MSFSALGLPENICVALAQAGLTTPTPVQAGAIPAALKGRDVISTARTGSGKTLAYSLPMLVRLSQVPGSAALVLVPTRELGVQVQSVLQPFMRSLGLGLPCLIIGGVSFGPQVAQLRNKPRVIIATPGRLIDHIQNGKYRMDNVNALVLDEADRMLDMGFLPQVRNILKILPSNRQTMLFTATMPQDLRSGLKDLLRDPEQILVDAPSTTNTDIEQRMIEVASTGKQDALLEAVNSKTESVLVFTRTKRRTDKVAQFLTSYGVKADRIHGDRSQSQRQAAITNFRTGKVKVLVATDIAARGLDIPLVELVINFDLPEGKEDYVHRIGRTGRAGAQGEAISFVAPEDRAQWADIMGTKRPAGAVKPVRNNNQPRGGGRPTFGRGPAAPRPQQSQGRPEGGARANSRWGSKPPQGNPDSRAASAPRGFSGPRPVSGPRTPSENPRFNGQQRRERPEGGRPDGMQANSRRPSGPKRWGAPRPASQPASTPAW